MFLRQVGRRCAPVSVLTFAVLVLSLSCGRFGRAAEAPLANVAVSAQARENVGTPAKEPAAIQGGARPGSVADGDFVAAGLKLRPIQSVELANGHLAPVVAPGATRGSDKSGVSSNSLSSQGAGKRAGARRRVVRARFQCAAGGHSRQGPARAADDWLRRLGVGATAEPGAGRRQSARRPAP